MANFPNTQPSLLNPISTDQMNSVTVPHAAQHANANDEIEAIAGFVGLVGSSNPVNLLSNGDMELWSAGASAAPDGWTFFGSGGSVGRTATKKMGSYSLSITRVTNNAQAIQSIHAEKGISYWQGRIVTFGSWVYATTAGNARLVIYDGVGSYASSYHSGNSTWQFLTCTGTINGSATEVTAYCQVANSDGTVYFDGAIAVEGAACPSFAPKPESGINVQTFSSSGTWTKPSTGNQVLIQLWAGGGSGGAGSGSGGGGGAYNWTILPKSSLSATESVVVGLGGAAVSGSNPGNVGGTSSFSTKVYAYGGGGGNTNIPGGGGGGCWSAGNSAGQGGELVGGVVATSSPSPGGASIYGGGGGAVSTSGAVGGNSYFGGGGGGGFGNGAKAAGSSIWGGGGGAASSAGSAGVAGTSIFGGAGGLGASGTASPGTVPSGGGGGSRSGTSGAGADGKAIITTF
jgi:hypothetical protein